MYPHESKWNQVQIAVWRLKRSTDYRIHKSLDHLGNAGIGTDHYIDQKCLLCIVYGLVISKIAFLTRG
jgi:hypothetical protein